MKKQVYLEIKNVLIKLKKVMTSTIEMNGVLQDDYKDCESKKLNNVLGKIKL